MALVNVLTVAYLVLMVICYVMFIQNGNDTGSMGARKAKVNWLNIGILLMLGLLVRYVLACIEPGYEVDMNCFSYWSDQVYRDGFANFYTAGTFADYPPGYMYILWVVGLIRSTIPSLASSTILVKMPAILCDLGTTWLIYKVAHKHFDEKSSILFAAFYLFNPVVLIDSAMWGQVDSVFTLFVAAMIYCIAEKKLKIAYFVFAIGILIKPQTLVLTPVLGYGILDQVIFHNFNWKRFFTELFTGLCAIGTMVLCVVPYGVKPVYEQYLRTLSSYPYATVNAYNFWGMQGLNWHSQDEKMMGLAFKDWGTIFIVLIVAATLLFCVLNKHKENPGKYYFFGAFIACGFFTMSVRVHERYMFPVFMLLIMAYVYKPRKEYLFLFMGLTVAQVNNIWHAFKFYDPSNFDWEAMFPKVNGFFHVLLFGLMIYVAIKHYVTERTQQDVVSLKKEDMQILPKRNKDAGLDLSKGCEILPSEKTPKFTKKDWIAMIAITVVYGVIALYNLGDKVAPQTHWDSQAAGEIITLDFSNKQAPLTELSYFLGRYENREFYVQQSPDGVNWYDVAVNGQDPNTGAEASKFTMVSVFCWDKASFYITEPYVRIHCAKECTVLNELVFLDEAGNTVVPVNAQDYMVLFDEQEMRPEIKTFRNSTYFDEIYHGRTAYEMVEGVYCYENTHPPLGKYIISIGIRLFGMCPFGWRIMGTLFGIAMLPILYLFARKMFKETWIASITTILFAADFMHFAQTRIATIDVYVTFFIILMYYFMFQYTRISFYDTPLKKTFIPLLCCGISMGLGCAAKWPGVYAGLGLAVIFFATMARRYLEYRYAWHRPKESTKGISHSSVINSFSKNMWYTLGFCCIAFIVIPGTIYTLSYIPFNDGTDAGLISRMLKNQTTMFSYHSDLVAEHPFSSWFYEWPTMKRPIWYYTQRISDNVQENISAFGNPLVWWAGVPAFVYMIYLSIRNRDGKATFLCVGYLAQFLPWFNVSRITFIYHYFPSVPFLTLMLGYSMYQFSKRSEGKYFKSSRNLCIVYAVAAVALFVMFYPVLSGYPIDYTYATKFLRWFDSWILVSG